MKKVPLEMSEYSRPFNILKYLGAWVVDPRHETVLNLYCFYKTVMTGLCALACFGLYVDFYMVLGDFKKMTWNLCVSILFTGAFIKNVYTFSRNNVLNGLRMKLHHDASTKTSEEDEALERSSLREWKSIQILFYGIVCFFVPVWLISRYVGYYQGQVDIPIPIRLPLDIDYYDPVQYHYVFVTLSVCGCFALTFVLEQEMGMFSVLVQLTREYTRLLKDIMKINKIYENFTEDCADFECQMSNTTKLEVNPLLRRIRTKILLKKCSTRQRQLIEYTKNFELTYGATMILQVFVASVLATVSGIQCVLEYGNYSANFVYQMGYLSIIITNLFLICCFTTRLREQCRRVGQEAYEILWYQMTADIRRDITMIITRSQFPPKITAGKVMEMDLHAFMVLMRNIYSWITLFLQLEFKGST